MRFEKIIGQSEIKARLLGMGREQRTGHALLFSGGEGTGMLGLAIAFARYLNCLDPWETDSCESCTSCRKYSGLVHPDLHFVFPVTQKKQKERTAVSDDFLPLWREKVLENHYMRLFQWAGYMGAENAQANIGKSESAAILRKLSLKSFEAKYKVMIIWMAEKMNPSSANQLLKILEEPPERTLFFLITENPGQILPTILSRTQQLLVPKIDSKSMTEAVTRIHGVDSRETAEGLVRMADGNYLRLLEAVNDSEESAFHLEMFVKLMRLCFKTDFAGISDWIDTMAPLGREKQKQFFLYALRMLRGNFIMGSGTVEIDLLSAAERDFSANFSKFVNENNIFELAGEFNRASQHIEANGYNKLVMFDLAVNTARLLKN